MTMLASSLKQERLLPALELEVMKVLWSLGEGTVGQVQLGMKPARPLAYTTVMTLLDRLTKKKAVTRRKQGRGYLYTPALSRDRALTLAVERLIRDFFNSPEELIEYLKHGAVTAGPGDRGEDSVAARPLESALL